ncbi:MAG: hypothetical protein GXP39_19980 [Chloroflexi bacterium]|nr:hypothetical protein [Chloroflexota bacterium]
MIPRSRAQQHGLALVSYGLLSLILTYPLILRFTTHVPGDGIDDPALTWNLWWVRYSLLELHASPFYCRWMFWPIGINLAFYTLTVLNGLLAIPLQLAWEVVPASNLLLLLSFILSGYGTFLLVRQVWGSRRDVTPEALWSTAWFAGLIYAFASNKLFYAALGQFNIASSQWVPFCALYVWRAGQRQGSWRDALLAGLFLGFQAWAEATYASFLLIFIALYALWIIATSARSGRPLAAWVTRLAIIGGVFALLIAPMLAHMLPDLKAEGDFFASGGGFADVFSADIAGYLVPTQHHPIFGRLADRLPFPHDKGQHVYIGYSVALLAMVGILRRPRRAALFWAACLLVFWLLTLGPTLRVAGNDTGIPGPFALVARLPFFKGNRYPSRYAVMLLLSAAVLAARGLQTLLERLPRLRPGALLGIASVLFLAEHLAIPLPLSDMRVPAIYQRIATETDATPGAVMELPLGWRNGARVAGKKDVIIMFEQWYQTVHHRPLLGGNTSRNPEFKFQYFSEAPLIDLLVGLVNAADEPFHQALRSELAAVEAWIADPAQAPPGWLEEQRQQARQVLRLLDIAYVVIHRDRVPATLERYVATILPVELIATEGDIALYRVRRDQLPPLDEIDLTSPQGRLALGEGWSPAATQLADIPAAVWAQRREVRLQVPASADVQGIEIRMYAPGPGQEASLIVNGREVDRQPVPETWGWVRFTWRSALHTEGMLAMRLRFSQRYDLPDILADPLILPDRSRVGGTIAIRSAGEEVGNFAHIYVNGVDRSPNRRGYNLALLDPTTAQVLGTASFDTHASAQASQAMADWLRSVPEGVWVLGAVKDEASLNLTEPAVQALREIGVITDLRGRFRWSHAFIGARGWEPGRAWEQVEAIRPASLAIGAPLSRPGAAAAATTLRAIPATDHE